VTVFVKNDISSLANNKAEAYCAKCGTLTSSKVLFRALSEASKNGSLNARRAIMPKRYSANCKPASPQTAHDLLCGGQAEVSEGNLPKKPLAFYQQPPFEFSKALEAHQLHGDHAEQAENDED
jgi:hypothetical protein